MSEDIQNFKQFLITNLQEYPVSVEDQHYIIKSRKLNLKTYLRQKAGLGIAFWFIISIGIFFKKFGLNLTFFQSKIVSIIIAAMVSATSATAVYYTAVFAKKMIINSHKMEDKKKEYPKNRNGIETNNRIKINKEGTVKDKIHQQSETGINPNNDDEKKKIDEHLNPIIDTPDM